MRWVVPASAHIQWSSANTAIATVDQSGVVTATALGGPAKITETLGALTATTDVTVVPADITITPVGHGIPLGATEQLVGQPRDYQGVPIDAGPVTWSSNAPGVMSVNASTGFLTALTVGTATISATAAGRTTQITLFSDVPSTIDGDYNSTGNNPPILVRVYLHHVTLFSATLSIFGCATLVTGQPDVVAGLPFTISATGSYITTATVNVGFNTPGMATGSIGGAAFMNRPCDPTASGSVTLPFFAVR